MSGEGMKTTQSGFAFGTDPNEESKANGRRCENKIGGSWGMDLLYLQGELGVDGRSQQPFSFEKDQPSQMPTPILLVGQGSRPATHHFVLLDVSFFPLHYDEVA
ncbi:hypothetical protein V6N11_077873 [Hibiscus sabdariffa]|uniref:Uncharacterized protein n=1 Tax=Hibiscus sabdariffa TaxID=183260 RepID=A0ABR2TEB9_9ROSI